MSDNRCNKVRKLSAKKAKHRRCYFKMTKISGAGAGTGGGGGGGNGSGNGAVGGSDCAIFTKNHSASSMHQFSIDSNIVGNTARKCSFSGKEKKNKNKNLKR